MYKLVKSEMYGGVVGVFGVNFGAVRKGNHIGLTVERSAVKNIKWSLFGRLSDHIKQEK